MRLKEVDLRSHPWLAPFKIELSERRNVLLGHNGVGKTTLLELITAIATSRFTAFEGQDFSVRYGLRFSNGEVDINFVSSHSPRGKLHHASSTIDELRARIERAGNSLAWRLTLNVMLGSGAHLRAEYEPGGGSLMISGEAQSRVLSPIDPFAERAFLHTALFDIADTAKDRPDVSGHLGSFGLEAFAVSENCYRFDEALGGFESMLGRGQYPAEFKIVEYNLHNEKKRRRHVGLMRRVPPELVEKVSREAGRWDDGIPVERLLPSTRFSPKEVSFLSTACRAMEFLSGHLELRAYARDVVDKEVSWRFRGCTFDFLGPGGRSFTQDGLSFGQKRLVAFLYYTACNKSLVIADELVNGLHHEWIGIAVEALNTRQAFLSSQNPLLLNCLEFDSVEDVRKSFIVCQRESGSMLGRNLTLAEAKLLCGRIESGIQHVSEILVEMGLW